MTTSVTRRRSPAATPDLLYTEDLVARLGISVTTLWRLRRDGTFPPPTHKLGRRPAWTREVYEAWLRDPRATVAGLSEDG